MDFSKRLRKLIEQLGNISAYRFALETDINQSQISRYLNGNSQPNIDTIKKIVAYAKSKKIDFRI